MRQTLIHKKTYIQEILQLKKLFAISLLVIYLFNLAGYSFLFEFFMKQSDSRLSVQLDNHQYKEAELIEIKVPLNLPYGTDWPDYRREDGEIELNGRYYSYVKKKLSNDTVYLKCLPNTFKNQLSSARNDYNRLANDLPSDDEGSGKSLMKKISVLYAFSQPITRFQFRSPERAGKPSYQRYSSRLNNSFTAEQLRPPIL